MDFEIVPFVEGSINFLNLKTMVEIAASGRSQEQFATRRGANFVHGNAA